MPTPPTASHPPEGLPLLRLMHLVSPALPIGAFAYSQGLEGAVERGWIKDEHELLAWLCGLLRHPLRHQDAPALLRLHAAWDADDLDAVARWNAWLYACRETRELRAEDQHLGHALARLLAGLGVAGAEPWCAGGTRACFATLFALAAVRWQVAPQAAAQGYLWAWAENQVTAATRLLPLGQSATQRILAALLPEIAACAAAAGALPDDELGASAPGLALASAGHETQYSRLFRS